MANRTIRKQKADQSLHGGALGTGKVPMIRGQATARAGAPMARSTLGEISRCMGLTGSM